MIYYNETAQTTQVIQEMASEEDYLALYHDEFSQKTFLILTQTKMAEIYLFKG